MREEEDKEETASDAGRGEAKREVTKEVVKREETKEVVKRKETKEVKKGEGEDEGVVALMNEEAERVLKKLPVGMPEIPIPVSTNKQKQFKIA